MRFAATHHNWEIQFAKAHPSNESLEHFADWHPDALVIDSSCHSLAPRELAAIAGRATAFAETAVPAGWRRPCATISTDDKALAAEAATLQPAAAPSSSRSRASSMTSVPSLRAFSVFVAPTFAPAIR